MTGEELFRALDGRIIVVPAGAYRIEVFSVRDESGQRWVQLALKDDGSQRQLTLRLKPGDTAQHAIFTLSAWLTDPAGTPEVFNVA